MKNNIIFQIARKEFFGFINSALAYTVMVPFLLLSIFIYTSTALTGGDASLRPFFELLPWFLLLVAPAISMKLLTDEYKNQSLELLFVHPISETQIVVGKLLGAVAFYVVILLATVGLPLSLMAYSRPDLGQILGQYIGALFVGTTFISVSIAASAYVKNAISSFLLGAAISFVLVIIGLDFITQMLPAPINLFAIELSVLTHGDNIARGLLDIRDVMYFITVIGLAIAVTVLKLSERKTAENLKEKSKLQLSLGLIIGIGVVLNVLLSFYPLRLDLTQGQLFTLSNGTRQTLKNIPDIVTITLFRSRQLPAQMQLVARDASDLLKDYEKLGKSARTKVVYTDDGGDAKSEALSAGVREIQFNSVGAGKFEVQAGTLGIGIRYGDKTDSIPFVQDSADLEYQITRRIRKLTRQKAQVIGLMQNGMSQHQILDEILRTQYEVKTITEGAPISPSEYAAVVALDSGNGGSTSSAQLKEYLDAGGSAFVMASGVSVDQQSIRAQKSSSPILYAFATYGVTINTDLIYDLQLAETLGFRSEDGRSFLQPYPFWFKALPVRNNTFAPLATVKSISMSWPSSLSLDAKEGVVQKVILSTGPFAGKGESPYNIDPKMANTLPQNAKEVPLAALIEKGNTKLVVVGTDSVVNDKFLQNNRDAIAFVSNTIDYVSAEKDVTAIPSKAAGRPVFEFKSQYDFYIVRYGNVIIPPLAVIVFAIIYLRKRKNRTQRVYVK